MEKPELGRLVICSIVVFLGTLAFSCSVAAEFKKVKAKDMKLDGSLCSLPRSSAFGLGIAAVVCLSIAQIVGTSTVCIRSGDKKKTSRSRIVYITLLVLSWISFGSAVILLATGSSMNGGQPYGKGWMDGNCYIVRNEVFLGAAVLVVTTVVFTLGFTYAVGATIRHRTRPDEGGRDHQQRKVIN
ncbi:protein MODIFYING WALL LIGNIN-1 [Elaeis guineensis]|uniref:Uncharacterized protein LOC105060845 n=1 Tax=Elaeis guineensis var. tenera TaxID=51953 RepID=A0A6I9SH32_ELAGV|nr:uncharacterized protein LOC105060845 [Elaeis guineensis]